jgi:hypothetical protein
LSSQLSIPFFSWCEAAVDEGFFHIQSTSDLEVFGKRLQNFPHYPGANPLLKTSMAGLVGWIAFGDIGPRSTRPQHPQNAVQDGAPILPWTSPSITAESWLRNKTVEDLPL